MTTTSELTNDEKVGLLRSLCQGYGMESATFVEKEDELRILVDEDAKEIERMFKSAADAMTDGKYKDAFLNALWARDYKNLTDRRTEFLAKKGDITYRTLIRHEQEGAEVFLKFLEAEARSSSSPYQIEENEDDLNVDLQALRIRVSTLESIISEMFDALCQANDMIFYMSQGTLSEDYVERFSKSCRDFNHGADFKGKTILNYIQGMPGDNGILVSMAQREKADKKKGKTDQADE